MNFAGKTVLITGGAQGIGRAVSEYFARAGAHAIIMDIDEQAATECIAVISAEGHRATWLKGDVASEEDCRSVAQQAIAFEQRLDVLINNAGIGDTQPMSARSMEQFDRVLAVNLRGPYMMAKYCAAALSKAAPGVIINLASTRALMSEPHTEPYAASKGGILALTHALAVSLGPSVRVNAISPGWIEVSDWKKAEHRATPQHSARDRLQHPVGRVGTPHDIAHACAYLASEEAGFITGTNLVIDGGMTIRMLYEE